MEKIKIEQEGTLLEFQNICNHSSFNIIPNIVGDFSLQISLFLLTYNLLDL